MRSRFLKHSDVQIILQRLGLPLIDLAYGQPLQTIEEDDHESEHVVVPVEVVDVDAEPSVSTESTEQQFGVQLLLQLRRVTPVMGLVAVVVMVYFVVLNVCQKTIGGWGGFHRKILCVMTETDLRNMTHARAAVVGAQACKSLAKATHAWAQLRKLKRQVLAQVTKTSKQKKLAQDSQPQPQPSGNRVYPCAWYTPQSDSYCSSRCWGTAFAGLEWIHSSEGGSENRRISECLYERVCGQCLS